MLATSSGGRTIARRLSHPRGDHSRRRAAHGGAAVPDGQGGAIITWYDQADGEMVQRVDASRVIKLPQRSRTTTLLIPEQSDRRWALDRRDHPGGSRLCSRQRGVFQARSESTALASLLLEAGRTAQSNA